MTTSPEFTPGPVSIEKVEEIWTSQSIATTFRFPSKSRISLQKSSSVIRSQNCGAGWQLALNIRGATALRRGKRVKGTARPELVFLPQAMESSWEGAIMSVQTTMIPRSVVDVATKPQSPVDGPTSVNLPEHQVALRGGPPDGKGVRLWSGQSLDRICDCDVTIKVTIVDRSAVSRILDSALGTGVYFDTKFLVNSKLEGSRKLFDLLPIYAHSSVLEEVCPALDILNSLDFAQVVESDLPLPELREYEYEYGSDSDIDERESIIEDVSEIVTAVEPDDLDQIQSSATGNSAPSVTLAGTDHQETARSASPYIDSIADSEILESINSEGHDSISQAIQVKCAAYKT
ncbi:hypothetical protein HYDPIDRAFT_165652 [Hydnomerulius pinastri MD-312]|nr:hypothetical protein HYDPIDRAFT_165652 [Hydnomerulius pinastri MD-312]